MAEKIACGIEDRIMAGDWPVGYPLGREVDLAAAAGVSRWTFREAVSLLEQNGLVGSRRGGGGGLFVAAPMIDTLCTGLANHLDFVRVTPAELVAALAAAEAVMIELVPARLDAESIETVRMLVAESGDPYRPEALLTTAALRRELVGLAGNPALSLLSGTLAATVMQAAWYSTLDDEPFRQLIAEMTAAIYRVARALLARRIAEAKVATKEYVATASALFEASSTFGDLPRRVGSTERAYQLYPPGRPQKKAERVARELRAIIVESGWEVGMHLGTEAELMVRFEVGRPVLREALRSLERMGVIAIGWGGASGVKVISPSPRSLLALCRKFLDRQQMSAEQAHQVRAALLATQSTSQSALTTDRTQRKRTLVPIMLEILSAESKP